MKSTDWRRAFGQPDEAFHRAFTETLDRLEKNHAGKRYRLSTLLIAAILLTLALAGAALATSGFGIFYLSDVTPLEGAEALVETNLGTTANELVRLTVEEAVRDADVAAVLLRLTPLDPEHYVLYNDNLDTAPEDVYILEETVGEDGATHRRIVGRTDGKAVIDYWPELTINSPMDSLSICSDAQPDGSVRIRMSVQAGAELAEDAVFTASAALTVNGERMRLADIHFTLSRKENARTAIYAPIDNGEIERVKIYGVQLSSTSVSAVARVSYAYLPKDEDVGISFHYLNSIGLAYELGEGRVVPLTDNDYAIPPNYEGVLSSDRLQAMAEFPEELILEAKVIGENTILGRVTLKRVDE